MNDTEPRRVGIPLTDAAKIRRVLRRHRWNSQAWRCLCGWEGKDHEVHQAEALAEDFTARVAAARADALAPVEALADEWERQSYPFRNGYAATLRAAMAVPEPGNQP